MQEVEEEEKYEVKKLEHNIVSYKAHNTLVSRMVNT